MKDGKIRKMSQIIADIYEIDQKIGSGGGGIVYLGRHLRLQKLVVLKADRRTLNTKQEALRREVDMLKNLSHSYIPQVYDFVQENGVVYTVMDYIEGESLDKVLKRGEKIAQPDVIRWGCQLLEALDYLHNIPPHGILHGDIKPANIMRRPNGDVCLIDFNIALALNEDGAVKVGFSRGYASPEHYGIEYGSRDYSLRKNTNTETDVTVVDDEADEKTVCDTVPDSFPSVSETKSKNGILLDARSDIYSLGATLYHLLSGRKPAQNAEDVKPLDESECSPAVSEIIRKSMEPNPDDRYQTAQEMLDAFLMLAWNDPRAKKLRTQKKAATAAIILMAVLGGGCTFIGLNQQGQQQKALADAAYSSELLQNGDVLGAVEKVLSVIPKKTGIFTAPIVPQAQLALTDALGVYQLKDGFDAKQTIELPANPFDMNLSPDGKKIAVVYGYEAAVYNLEDGKLLKTFPIQQSALADCVFVDDNTVVYASDKGITAYALDKDKELWTGETATMITVSADKETVAAVNRDKNYAVIYDSFTGEQREKCSFGEKKMYVASNDIFADPKDSIFALDKNGTHLAVSFSDGGLMIFNLKEREQSLDIYDSSEYAHFNGGFFGDYFAFTAGKGTAYIFQLVDIKNGVSLGEYQSQDTLSLQVDENGIYLAEQNLLVCMNEQLEQTEAAYTDNVNITSFAIGENGVLVTLDDNSYAIYDNGANKTDSGSGEQTFDFALLGEKYAVVAGRDVPALRVLQQKDYGDKNLFSYDVGYAHDEARISGDGKTAMLFGINGFRIYDRNGNLINETQLEDSADIYDEQYRKEDVSYLEVMWYDGTIRKYNAADGSLLEEEKTNQPEKDLYEEFYTDAYKISSSLHEAPQVYDKKTNKFIKSLEKEDYLTYVTQEGDYIITEYINTEGERYGLLLDKNLETIAYLPDMCDISDNHIIFDYGSGELRESEIYRLSDLIEMAQKMTEQK